MWYCSPFVCVGVCVWRVWGGGVCGGGCVGVCVCGGGVWVCVCGGVCVCGCVRCDSVL